MESELDLISLSLSTASGPSRRKAARRKLTTPHFIPDLRNHSQARNLTRKLIERGFSDEQIEKILRRNWLRIFKSGCSRVLPAGNEFCYSCTSRYSGNRRPTGAEWKSYM